MHNAKFILPYALSSSQKLNDIISKVDLNNLYMKNPAIFGHSGIVAQSLSSLSSFTPQPDCLKNISHFSYN